MKNKQQTPQRNLRRFALWGDLKKNVSFYEVEHFVLFFRNASFCGLYKSVKIITNDDFFLIIYNLFQI